MTIASGINSPSGLSAADWQQQFQQARKDFTTLAQALQSGDLGTAKQAYAALQKDLPNQSAAPSQSGAAAPASPLAALGQALQSGDMPAAQQAFAAMQQARHGHHHRAAASAQAQPPVAPAPATDGDGDGDDGGNPLGSVLNASA